MYIYIYSRWYLLRSKYYIHRPDGDRTRLLMNSFSKGVFYIYIYVKGMYVYVNVYIYIIILQHKYYNRPYGAMVARLTPDQKVGCSSHSGVMVVLVVYASTAWQYYIYT